MVKSNQLVKMLVRRSYTSAAFAMLILFHMKSNRDDVIQSVFFNLHLLTQKRQRIYLAEVDEEGAGGSIHAVVGVAAVRAPHLLHPLRKRRRQM